MIIITKLYRFKEPKEIFYSKLINTKSNRLDDIMSSTQGDTSFVCRRYEDLNRNDRGIIIVSMNEFLDIKNEFRGNTFITAVVKLAFRKNSRLDYRVINPDGKFIGYFNTDNIFTPLGYEEPLLIEFDKFIEMQTFKVNLDSRDKPGIYKLVWYVNGEPYLSNELKIVKK